MGKIKLLDNSMINKIAAGEVVERPSSVVKELVENSIDAGATIITIEVKEGGLSLIRISDNGSGIQHEDVQNVFLRHATSKIQNITDLERVLTLGFRGEAMSSIAAVSQIEMITKPENANVGTYIEINGGEVVKKQSIGAANGTSIIIRNLFYNVPARRKFLKKPSTEGSYITDIIKKFVLCHPNIAFKYILNSKKVLDTNGSGGLNTSIFHVYGKEVAKALLKIDNNINDILLKGYIGKPETYHSNKNYGNFFVNGRYIQNQLVQLAVEEGFKTKLPVGKFPVYILNLTIDPTLVDVNVHPTKLEIKFSNEEDIYNLVLSSVVKVLNSSVLIPKYTHNKEIKNTPITSTLKENIYVVEEVQEDIINLIKKPQDNNSIREVFSSLKSDNNKEKFMYVSEPKQKVEYKKVEEPKNIFFNNYKIIGQVLNTYWLIEQNASVYLIDQHAAHERVLYEEFITKYKNSDIVSQRLLQPQAVTLSITEREVFYENKEFFEKLGFEIEVFGEDSFAIRAVPFIFKEGISPKVFLELVDKLSNIGTFVDDIYDTKLDNIASFACKAAVKANDKLDYIEAKSLIEKMLAIENPFTCPHGRPTIVELTKYELEKMFKRVK